MGMSLDFKDFMTGLRLLCMKNPAIAGEGLFRAGNELLHDAIYKRPFAPFDKGDLRGSARTDKAEFDGTNVSTKVGFNIVYAARWHELTPEQDARIHWTLPGSGRKYLETKMQAYRNDYMKIVADYIAQTYKGGF